MLDLSQHSETHSNGSAILALTAHVSQDSFADHHSTIKGHSTIINSSLINSQAQDSTIVNSRILGSSLRASVATDAIIRASKLENVIIAGLFGKSPEIDAVELANCTIEGPARLIGPWTLNATARIHEGEWYRAPRYRVISSTNGVVATLTECVNGRALIACRCHDMRRWQRSGPRLGRMLGWPAELVQEAWQTFEEWLDDPSAQSERPLEHNRVRCTRILPNSSAPTT